MMKYGRGIGDVVIDGPRVRIACHRGASDDEEQTADGVGGERDVDEKFYGANVADVAC